MRIAVLTMTRDRLDYTRYCFATLRAKAGCDFDHYVLDQASEDGTAEWLESGDEFDGVAVAVDENLGVCRGLNLLLNEVVPVEEYDVIVRFDNDCEVLQPGTLSTIAKVAVEYDCILAPHVQGLQNKPQTIGRKWAGDLMISETGILGGIFMVIPARLFTEFGYRYDESHHPHTGDEEIVPWWRARGGVCGYLDGFAVNHYETTAGQRSRHPAYWERKNREYAHGL